MWLDKCPDESEELRQGDLLVGLFLPKLAWPVTYARAADEPVGPGQPVVLPSTKVTAHIVVSQCCAIESHRVTALAVVRSTKRLSASELEGYEREEPSEGLAYTFNQHALAPFDGHLGRVDGRISVADFGSIQTYSGAIEQLQAYRVAGMTPAGRRVLRIRLAAYWGRPEAEDAKALASEGIPPGSIPLQAEMAGTSRVQTAGDQVLDAEVPAQSG
jgi:hypothetical protein